MECRVNKLATLLSTSQIITRNSPFAQQHRVGCVRDNIRTALRHALPWLSHKIKTGIKRNSKPYTFSPDSGEQSFMYGYLLLTNFLNADM
jgi:hypothetical protein